MLARQTDLLPSSPSPPTVNYCDFGKCVTRITSILISYFSFYHRLFSLMAYGVMRSLLITDIFFFTISYIDKLFVCNLSITAFASSLIKFLFIVVNNVNNVLNKMVGNLEKCFNKLY